MDLRDKILGADDLRRELVSVPEWDADIYIQEMTGSDRDQYEAALIDKSKLPTKEKLKNMRAELVVLTAVDESGARIFSDDDIALVGAKNAKVLSRLAETAQMINRLNDELVEEEAGN